MFIKAMAIITTAIAIRFRIIIMILQKNTEYDDNDASAVMKLGL